MISFETANNIPLKPPNPINMTEYVALSLDSKSLFCRTASGRAWNVQIWFCILSVSPIWMRSICRTWSCRVSISQSSHGWHDIWQVIADEAHFKVSWWMKNWTIMYLWWEEYCQTVSVKLVSGEGVEVWVGGHRPGARVQDVWVRGPGPV